MSGREEEENFDAEEADLDAEGGEEGGEEEQAGEEEEPPVEEEEEVGACRIP